jgi:putative hydrolase of HD superfamily
LIDVPSPTLVDRINHLKQLPRTGWLLAGVTLPESVAEHSFATTLLAWQLAEAINVDWMTQGLQQPLDVNRVLRMALVHDLAESLLTDLPKRSTELIGRAIKYTAEAQATTQLFADAPGGDQAIKLWEEYAAGETPEAHLVHDADKLEMVHQALCYEARGHRNLAEFWQGHSWHYPISRALFAAWEQRRM